jgi:predicted O-linked N-acetylglucosamine transferase (SPINDLY family)
MTPMTIDQAIQYAFGLQQSGRLAETEALYRQILAVMPQEAHALHWLGILAGILGHTNESIDLMGRAIGVNPNVAEYHHDLGETYRRAGRWEGAIREFQRAIEIKPELAEPHINLALAFQEAGRLEEAIVAYERAIAKRPGRAETHNNLGTVLFKLDRPAEAIAAYGRALELKPDYAEAHNNLGTALFAQGRSGEAIAAYGRALALNPDYAEAHNNLGGALAAAGRGDEAIAAYHRALALKPDYAKAYHNLGSALTTAGRFDEAIAAYGRAVTLQPESAEAFNDLGIVLAETGHLAEAMAAYDRSAELKPNNPAVHNNRGNILKDQGRIDEALACFRRAMALNPDSAEAASNVLVTVHYDPGYDAQAILAEHRRWAQQYAEPLAASIRPHGNDRTPDRRLRIGFVSPDFRDHPVGQLLVPLFAHRDRERTEIFGYSDVRVADATSEKLKGMADQWRDTVAMGDAELAERIRGDGIDILVDLALHTAGNRMRVFACKPAPVQVTMLGLPATTGLSTIDYRLTDPYLDSPGVSDGDYSEQSIRLPHCFWIFQPPEGGPPVGASPGQRNGFVTFGCLNQFAKVSGPTLDLWVRILKRVPDARLVIRSQPGGHLDRVRALFRAGGVAPDRVEFTGSVRRQAYLERYHELDVCLDPFPYNGHTSTLDALWMGVPVITLAGRTAVGRGGVSILSNVGLPELIAHTPDRYVALSVELAGDRARLAELRAGLRARMQSSPLLDARQYAADVGAALRQMWTTWCEQ